MLKHYNWRSSNINFREPCRKGRIAVITPEADGQGQFALRILAGDPLPVKILGQLISILDPDGSLRRASLEKDLSRTLAQGPVRLREHESRHSVRTVFILEELRDSQFQDVKQLAQLWVSSCYTLDQGVTTMWAWMFWLLTDAALVKFIQAPHDMWEISEAPTSVEGPEWGDPHSLVSELYKLAGGLSEEPGPEPEVDVDLSQRTWDPVDDDDED